MINEFSKRAGSKINIRKLIAFLYTNNNQLEYIKGEKAIYSTNTEYEIPGNKPKEKCANL